MNWDTLIDNAKMQIQAEEDKLIFDALDAIAREGVCLVNGHAGHLGPLADCPEKECVARYVMDS